MFLGNRIALLEQGRLAGIYAPDEFLKATEPEVLKAHLGEWFAAYPALRLLTGDALFCQRPLARLIVEAGRDYLFAVKDNQPDLHEATQTAFADATAETADAGTRG